MSYLYLNFYDNLNQGSKSWDDFFTLSLTEQYDSIKRRIGRFAPSTIQELVSACCPLTYQTYYVSMPGFDRQTTVNKTKIKRFVKNTQKPLLALLRASTVSRLKNSKSANLSSRKRSTPMRLPR